MSDVISSSRRIPLPVIDRRSFLAQSSLLALGAMVASACGSSDSGPSSPGTVNVTVNPASYPALATVGGIARISGTSTPIAVVRSSTSAYRAFWLICPHQGSTVGINGTSFLCPGHGAMFSGTGAWTGGQPTSNLHEFTVTADANAGTITITS